jgi:hypothetical protein
MDYKIGCPALQAKKMSGHLSKSLPLFGVQLARRCFFQWALLPNDLFDLDLFYLSLLLKY